MASRSEHAQALLPFAVLSALPLSAMALFFLFVLHTRLKLGYWPFPQCPDPGEMGVVYELHGALVIVAVFVVAPAAPLGLSACLFFWRELLAGWRSALAGLLGFLVFYGVFWAWVRADPWHLLVWFAD